MLDGIAPGAIGVDELVLLLIWTKPLVPPQGSTAQQRQAYLKDKYAVQARAVLNIDSMQSQGLLRNCDRRSDATNNLITIVETHFSLARSMPEDAYMALLRNAVYSATKATELKQSLEVVGFNWYNLKEQIKMIQLSKAPQVASKMLQKNLVKEQAPKDQHFQ